MKKVLHILPVFLLGVLIDSAVFTLECFPENEIELGDCFKMVKVDVAEQKAKLLEIGKTETNVQISLEQITRLLENNNKKVLDDIEKLRQELQQELQDMKSQQSISSDTCQNSTNTLLRELEELQQSKQSLEQELQNIKTQQNISSETCKNTTDTMRQEVEVLQLKCNSSTATDAVNKQKSFMELVSTCQEASVTGLYKRKLNGIASPITVLCEMDTFDGGWTVIQQRMDGSVNFNLPFSTYKQGFGTVGKGKEFWLGLEPMHQMTKNGPCELAIEVKTKANQYFSARYTDFGVASEGTQYTMNRLGVYSGTGSDRLVSYAKNAKFTTYDRDQNSNWYAKNGGFARSTQGGWWFRSSWASQLNGQYSGNDVWTFYWNGHLRYSRMMIRC